MFGTRIFQIMIDCNFAAEECLLNREICAALTQDEIKELVPILQRLYRSDRLSDFLYIIQYSRSDFMDEFSVSLRDLQKIESDFNDFSKYSLMFLYAANFIESFRCRVCNFCENIFYSKNDEIFVCEDCERNLSLNFLRR